MNNKIRKLFFVLVAMLFLLIGQKAWADTQDVYDQVMKSHTIRCTYALRPPLLAKDINTGRLSGIGYDLTEEIGKRLSLKIEWVEETGFGSIIESIKTHRADMACGIYWANSARAPYIGFTHPIYFETLYVYSRKDDTRKISSFDELNDPKYSFSSIDGGTPIVLQKQLFPLSKQKTLPELSDLADTFEDLVTKKVDFVLQPEITTVNFEKARPDLIKKLLDKPVTYYPVVMFLPLNDYRMKSMVDTVLMEIDYDGTLERLLKKYHLEKMMKHNPLPQDY